MSEEIRIEKKINDSIHGFIGLSRIELDLVDTPIFQRLRRIKQVSPADFVFPGATHTRFSHSIGSKYLMEQVLSHVKKENGPIAHNVEETQKLRLAALLHDLGHYPLSHTGEKAVERAGGRSHEDFGADLMKLFLKEKLATYSADELSALIRGVEPRSLYCQILSSKLDVDKLDYLMRDSYHAGVTYGQIDINRIIRAMSFDKEDHMVFENAGPALENALVGRYHLYRVVNQHKAVTAFELMAERIYFLLMQNGTMPRPDDLIKDNDVLSLTTYDDNLLAQAMVQHLRKKEPGFLTDLINMYLGREPLKVVWQGSRLTDKDDFPKEHMAIRILQSRNMEDQLEKLSSKVQKDVPKFTSQWLFPVSLTPIRLLPEDTPIYVRTRRTDDSVPVETERSSIFNLVGKAAIFNTRLYTRPGLEEKIRPIFIDWSKSVF